MRPFAAALCALLICCLAHSTDPAPLNYELHEWGVFTVPRNAAWSGMDMRAEWDSMPDFFYRVWPKEKLPWHGPVTKPVVFIHAEKTGSVNLKIRFAEGRPIVWWPAASSPAGGVGDPHTDTLEFSLRVGDPGKVDDRAPAQPPAVEAGHWIEYLRAVKASMLYTYGGHSRRGYEGDKADSFLYYDGLMKAPATPALSRNGAKITFRNPHPFEMLDMVLIERDGKEVRAAGKWSSVKPGEEATFELTLADDAALERLRGELVEHLAAAGLNKLEAESLEKTWHPGFFQADGLTMFYRVPQDTYEKWLPLTAAPQPAKTVRVGIVYHAHMEPELNTKIEKLIAALGSENFDDRQAAQQALVGIGGAAFPVLEAHFKDENPEIATRCRKIVEVLDARPALKREKKE